jgi:uncharacterized phage-associated protein
VYHEFKKFRGNPITSQAGFCEDEDVDDLDMFTKALLEKIWNIYSHLTAMDLSRITHLPESPWFQAKSSDSKTDAISDSLIMSHFESELKLTN